MSDYLIYNSMQSPTLQVTAASGNAIFTITAEGELIWHDASKAGEAVDILFNNITVKFEDNAGIRYRREQWENDIKDALVQAARTKELTPEIVEEVFTKHKMISKLKGKE